MTSVTSAVAKEALGVRIEQCLQHTAAATSAEEARVAVDALLAEHHSSPDILALLLRELLVGIFHGFPSLPSADVARSRLLSRESDLSSTDYVRQWPSRIGTVPPPAEICSPPRVSNHIMGSPSRAVCVDERSDSSSRSDTDVSQASSEENKTRLEEQWSAALHSSSATHQDLINALMDASPTSNNMDKAIAAVAELPSDPAPSQIASHESGDDIIINKDDDELNFSYQVEMKPSVTTVPSALNALELRYILDNVFNIVLRDVSGVFDVAILNEIYSTLLLSLSRVGADTESTALASELYSILLLFNDADVEESSSIMMDMVESIIYEHLLSPEPNAAPEDYEQQKPCESPINDSITSSSTESEKDPGNPQMGFADQESSSDDCSSSSGSNGSEGVHAWDMPRSPLGFRRRIGGFGMPFRLPSLEADESEGADKTPQASNSNGSGFMAPPGDSESSSHDTDSLNDALEERSCNGDIVIETNDINVHDLPADFGVELLEDENGSPITATAASLDDDFDNLIVLHGVSSDLNKIISPRSSPEGCLHRKRSGSGSSSNHSVSKTVHIDVTVPTLTMADNGSTPVASPAKQSPHSPTVLVSPSKAKTFLTEFKEEESSEDDSIRDEINPEHFPKVRDTSTAAMYDALLQQSAGQDSDIVSSFRHIVQQYSNQLYPYDVHDISDEEAAAHLPMTTEEIAERVHLSSDKKKRPKKNISKTRPKSAPRSQPRTASAGASTMRKLSLYSLDTDAYEVLQSPRRRRKKREVKAKRYRSRSGGNLLTPTASSSAKTAASRLSRSTSSDRGQWLGV